MRRLLFVLVVAAFVCTSTQALSWKCFGCRVGAEVLKMGFERNATENEIISVARFICDTFVDVSAPNICSALTAEYRETFLYVLAQLVLAPTQMCAGLVENCGDASAGDNWTLPLPPKPRSKHFGEWRKNLSSLKNENATKTLRIVQLSDLHFDFDYLPGSEAECTESLCCSAPNPRQNNDARRARRQAETTGVKRPSGYWGSHSRCDVPYRTIENLFQHLNRSEKMDMVLFTGDYMGHRDALYSRAEHLQTLQNLSALADAYLSAVPVYSALGNHDTRPLNQFAPHFAPDRFSPRWLYDAMLDDARRHRLLPPEAAQSTRYRGSYSVLVWPGLRLISLNTGYSETTNFFIYVNQTDPDGTLSWLIDELYSAERRSEAVYIAGHIPSGADTFEGWARNYVRIINRFEDTIRAQFFGHVHVDTFIMHFEDPNDPNSCPTGVQFIAPSVTTFNDLNPAYRVYTVDAHSWEVLDFETRFMNLTSVATTPEPCPAPAWELLYTARDAYGLPDLQPQSWANLIDRIQRDNETARTFMKNYFRRDGQSLDGIDGVVCAMRSAHHNNTALCGDVQQKPKYDMFANRRQRSWAEQREQFVADSHIRDLTASEFFALVKNNVWEKVIDELAAESRDENRVE